MTTFYIIRHGEKESFYGNPYLSELGKKEAEYTAKYLKDKDIKLIVSSPRNRTLQTAEIIAKELNLDIEQDHRLEERMEWDTEGETEDQFMSEWVKTDADRNYKPSHGDSSKDCGNRVDQVLEEISSKHNGECVLIVSHGGAIADLLRNHFPDESLPLIKYILHNVKYMNISECSVTIIEKSGMNFKLVKVADTSHIPTSLV